MIPTQKATEKTRIETTHTHTHTHTHKHTHPKSNIPGATPKIWEETPSSFSQFQLSVSPWEMKGLGHTLYLTPQLALIPFMGLTPKSPSLEKQGAMVFTSLHDWHSTKRWLLKLGSRHFPWLSPWACHRGNRQKCSVPSFSLEKLDCTLFQVLPESKASNKCALGSDWGFRKCLKEYVDTFSVFSSGLFQHLGNQVSSFSLEEACSYNWCPNFTAATQGLDCQNT